MKVKVKLFDRCYVGGKIREKDEIVEVAEEIAKDFGELVIEKKDFGDGLFVSSDDSVQSLEARYGKPELLELAGRAKAEFTKDNNKTELVTKILEAVKF
jgi:hypothetical protein